MGSKEEKHIVIEFQKKILQEAGCSAEVIAFLDEIEDEVFCEYYCFCFLDGMPIEEVRRIDSVPVQNWKDKIKCIRTGYLERLFVPDAQVTQQISKLHEKAGRVFKETEELRDTINTTLKQTLKIQEEALVQQKESYQSTLASKAELLKDREDKIQSLLSEIEQNKAVWENEKKDLLLKLEEKKTAVKEEEKKEAAFTEENPINNIERKKKRWHFFCKGNKKRGIQDNNNEFIETYLAEDTFNDAVVKGKIKTICFNDAQKEFLIQCLEEGDSVQEMKTYASASLTPAMMQRLRQVRKKRRERP